MLASLVSAPAFADEPPGAPGTARDKPVPTSKVQPDALAEDRERTATPRTASWPAAGKAELSLAGDRAQQDIQVPWNIVDPASIPVRVRPAGAAPQASTTDQSRAGGNNATVRVEILDRAKTRAAGVDGVLLTLGAGNGKRLQTEVELDYSGFANAHGASWGRRLTLAQMPACALITPSLPECRTRTRLPAARNNTATATLTVPLTLEASSIASPMLLAATAEASGDSGDFSATSLAPSGTWTAGDSGGGFTWTYGIEVPPSPGTLKPDLSLEYSSQAVDGRMSATNNQPGLVGDGWSLSDSFVERRYKVCSEDMDGGANTEESWDLCWFTDNAVLSLNGRTSELVRDDSTGTWKPVDDDGTKVERLTDSATANGDNDGEHWKVTDPVGVQYYFGLNRLPGWTEGKPETSSAFTVPVFGNHAGEPCRNNGSYASSWCQQAWRWNLDYVVDPRGNAMAYYYTQETNNYGRNVNRYTGDATATKYVRGGWTDRIEYGLRSDNLFAPAPGLVKFDVSERCVPVPSANITCDPAQLKLDQDATKDTTKYWPDVPFDQNCNDGEECEDRYAPTFWTRKRLTAITTKVLVTGTHQDVDTWTLEQSFPPTGDVAQEFPLWLNSITRTGKAGSGDPITLPPVTFDGIQMDNRVDGLNDGAAPFIRRRIDTITSETGAVLSVVYSDKECAPGNVPPADGTNSKRCYPVYWQRAGQTDPEVDYFHKYVALEVREHDSTAGSPADTVTSYEYVGGPAWAKSTDEFTKPEHRTYSEYRGYETVKTRTGLAPQQRTLTETVYFRGIDGAQVNDSENNPVTDHVTYRGKVREIRTYDGDGGPLITATTYTPWHSAATATHARTGLPALESFKAGDAETSMREAITGGLWRRTKTTNTFDAHGMVIAVDHTGDTAKSGDESCVHTEYARNPAANILTTVSRIETLAVACTATPVRPRDVISDQLTYYDGLPFGAPPTKALATGTQQLQGDGTDYDWVTRTTYDQYGRTDTVTDTFDRVTDIDYTPAAGEAPSKVTVTDPKQFVTVSELDSRRNLATGTVDANLNRTDREYDTLGRLTKGWDPGWSKTGHENYPVISHTYNVSRTSPTVITTRRILENANYLTSYTIYDALLRQRQTQTPTAGGRLLTEIYYDSRGQQAKLFNPYYTTGTPDGVLAASNNEQLVPNVAVTEYDGAGRVTAQIAKYKNTERNRVTTLYGGDRTTTIPPAGATPKTSLTDALGNIVEIREYTAAVTGDVTGVPYQSTFYEYGDRGLLTKVVDPGGNTWTYGYDYRNRRTSVNDPDSGLRNTEYDRGDRVTGVTDARGVTLTTTYDELDRPTEMSHGTTTLSSWTYDTLAKGLPASSTRYIDGQPYTLAVTGYNSRSQKLGDSITIPATEGALAGTYTRRYGYNDPNGSPVWTELPSAGGLNLETIGYTYNTLGLLNTTSGTIPYVSATTYNSYGSITGLDSSISGKRVYQRFSYDEHDQKLLNAKLTRQTPPVELTDTTYTYDPAGNITRITELQGAGTGTVQTDTQCFAHDALTRMTEAWTATDNCATRPATGTSAMVGGPDAYWTSYTYDAVGNRTTETLHGLAGAADTVRTYTTDGHKVTGVTTAGPGPGIESYGYDETGNTTRRTLPSGEQTLTWDVEGHLGKVTGPGAESTYLYSADGDRLMRKDPGKTTLYLGETELTYVTAIGKVLGTRTYTHLGKPIAVRAAKPTTGITTTFLGSDHHGTASTAVELVTQQAVRKRTSPFGSPRGPQPAIGTTAGTWPNDKGFLGKPEDVTGLTHIGAREYDPAIGRFISVDPIMDLTDTQQMHGYSYSNNNPITLSDPTGLCLACGVIEGIRILDALGSGGGGGGGSGGSGRTSGRTMSGPPAPPPAPVPVIDLSAAAAFAAWVIADTPAPVAVPKCGPVIGFIIVNCGWDAPDYKSSGPSWGDILGEIQDFASDVLPMPDDVLACGKSIPDCSRMIPGEEGYRKVVDAIAGNNGSGGEDEDPYTIYRTPLEGNREAERWGPDPNNHPAYTSSDGVVHEGTVYYADDLSTVNRYVGAPGKENGFWMYTMRAGFVEAFGPKIPHDNRPGENQWVIPASRIAEFKTYIIASRWINSYGGVYYDEMHNPIDLP